MTIAMTIHCIVFIIKQNKTADNKVALEGLE